jgi:hypothetical protein
MTVSASSPTPGSMGLFANSVGLYRSQPANFLASFLLHVMGLALVFWVVVWIPARPPGVGPEVFHAINVGTISFFPDPGGHGGGGTHDKTSAGELCPS